MNCGKHSAVNVQDIKDHMNCKCSKNQCKRQAARIFCIKNSTCVIFSSKKKDIKSQRKRANQNCTSNIFQFMTSHSPLLSFLCITNIKIVCKLTASALSGWRATKDVIFGKAERKKKQKQKQRTWIFIEYVCKHLIIWHEIYKDKLVRCEINEEINVFRLMARQ